MGKKLYVGNLSPEANEASLKALFSMFGAVEKAYIIPDPKTGKGKGYGFVIMSSDAEANAAISGLNGTDFDGRPMKVNEAKPQTKRSGGGHGGFGGGRW